MPLYEFYCPRCEKTFERLVTLRAVEDSYSPVCPNCGEINVARIFSRFSAGTSSSSSSGPYCPPSGGSSCCG